MSAFPNSPAAPEHPLGSAPKSAKPKLTALLRGKKWPILVLLAVALAAAWLLRPQPQAKTAVATVIPTVKASRGALQRTIRVTGSITAKKFVGIVAPVMQGPDAGRSLVLIHLAESGTIVKKDQVVAQIDGQAIKDHLADLEAELSQADLEIRRRKAQQDAEMEYVRQRARAARASLEKAQQDARATEVKSALTQELLKLAVEEAQSAHSGAEEQVAMTEERQGLELRILDLGLQRQVRHRDRHKTDFIRFTIHTPMDGLVVMQTLRRGHGGDQAQVKVGDELSPGQPFMQVVDLSNMQLDATFNQAESESVRIGQRATVRFDAFPELALHGRVEAVGAMAVGGRRTNYYIRKIPVRIMIDGRDPRVIPDLTASADVVVSEEDDRLIVPREAVREAGGKSVVYVKQAGAFTPREVEIGGYSNTHAAVISGIQEGEEVALQPPEPLNR